MITRHLGMTALGILLAAATMTGPALADDADRLVEECHIQLELTDSGCACIGESARRDLTEEQQAFVVAQVTDDKAASDAMMQDMTMDEMTFAAEWMMNAPFECEQP